MMKRKEFMLGAIAGLTFAAAATAGGVIDWPSAEAGPVAGFSGRLAPNAGWVSMRPRLYDMFAIVHRAGATLSPAAQLMIELATKRIQSIATPM